MKLFWQNPKRFNQTLRERERRVAKLYSHFNIVKIEKVGEVLY
jgi:hypothetical protein